MNTISNDNKTAETEYIILENIYNSSDRQHSLSQRNLAHIAGTSLGMTNSILKRLAQKGWISIKKLNSRNIQYVVTLEGFNEIIHRSYVYFKRTIKNVVFYKDILENLMHSAKNNNISTVALIGQSDLDFIVEHACQLWGLNFTKSPKDTILEENSTPETFTVFAESIATKNEAAKPNVLYLSRLIMTHVSGGNTLE